MTEKEFVLSLPKETKIRFLEDSLKEDNFGIFFRLTKILLDAPILEGGMSTEEIEEIRKKYIKPKQR